LAACAQQGAGERPAAIVGGTTDDGDPAVVALIRQGRTGEEICTGEIISPTTVLTAAHCVAPDPQTGASAWDTFSVVLGTDTRQSSQRVPVSSVHYDPQWMGTPDPAQSPEGAGHDVGVALLAQPIPNITPLPVSTAPMTQAQVGQPVRLVGYGITDGTFQMGDGVKRQVTTSLVQILTGVLYIGRAGQQGCQGDSGGPALMRNGAQEVIVGLTSSGDNACTRGGYYTRLDTVTSFLTPYLPSGTGWPTTPTNPTPPADPTAPTAPTVPTAPTNPPPPMDPAPPASNGVGCSATPAGARARDGLVLVVGLVLALGAPARTWRRRGGRADGT
jgi:secreted trypsin-like serine protease